MTANINDFRLKTLEENRQSLADCMPNSKFFIAKNKEDTNMYKLVKAEAKEFQRANAKVANLASQFIPNQQDSIIDLWEQLLGIPDKCIKINVSDLQRRIDIIVKLGYLNLQIKQDYYNLAEILNVEILSWVKNATFDYTITIKGTTGDTFQLLFDPVLNPTYGAFLFGSESEEFFKCLVLNYKPLYVNLTIVVQE